jgi:hypothetical protein
MDKEVFMPTMFEALFLLALDDDEGYIVESAIENLERALAGAVLAELALQKRIELIGNRILVSNQECTGHPILDKAFNDMIDETRPRKSSYWINTLAYKKLLQEIGHDLVDQGVLSRQKKRLHLAITSGEDQVQVASLKFIIKSQLREIVLAGKQPELSDLALLSFLYHADLLRLVFTVGERRIASKEIKTLLRNGEMSEILKTIVATACDTKDS